MDKITLRSMLGPVGRMAPFQWIKIIRRSNIVSHPEKGEPILISNDFICTSFYDSKSKEKTTNDLANIMLLTYLQWISDDPQKLITGVIAEEIHNKTMRSIATHWQRPWRPERHKCPTYGILNLFSLIRKQVQYDFLPRHLVSSESKNQRCNKKNQFRKLLIDNAIYTDQPTMDYMTKKDPRYSNPLMEWDCYDQLDAHHLLLAKDELGHDFEADGLEYAF